jgi:hypothetical protein
LASSTSYTQRTLAALRERGGTPDIVERFLSHAGPHGVHKDLFGLFDIIALFPFREPGRRLVGAQSTGPNGYSEHMRTFVESKHIDTWLSCGGAAELWCWQLKPQAEGSKVLEWQPRIIDITPGLLVVERLKPRKPRPEKARKDPGIPVYTLPT